jgi:hypothetical protein
VYGPETAPPLPVAVISCSPSEVVANVPLSLSDIATGPSGDDKL